MATIGNSNLTLADIAAQTQDGKLLDIVELLNLEKGILEDMVWIQANNGTTHKSVVRTGLPSATWRQLYGGIQPSKSTTAPVLDACGMLEALSEPDVDLIDQSADPGKARLNEAASFIEAMGQTLSTTVIYGDQAVNPERFTGLAPRYNTVSTATAQTAYNVVDAGGTGSDNSSIWLCSWDETKLAGLYPRGSQAGLKHNDEGTDWIDDPASTTGAKFKVYRDHFKWDAGLTAPDWRYAGRIANIDVSDLGTLANTKVLVEKMVMLSERVKRSGRGRTAWYMNRTIREKLRLGILEKIATNLTWETVSGQSVMMFDGIPVRQVDAILNTEARLV